MNAQSERLAEHLRSGPRATTVALVCASKADFEAVAHRVLRRVTEAAYYPRMMDISHEGRFIRGYTADSFVRMRSHEFESVEFVGLFGGERVGELFSLIRPRIRPRGET